MLKNIFTIKRKNKLGQHLTEFLILFLAVVVAFFATQVYLRRGVSASLKKVELGVNKAVGASGSSGQSGESCRHVWVRLVNTLGQTLKNWEFDLGQTAIDRWNGWAAGPGLVCCGLRYSSVVDPNNSSCALAGTAPFCADGFCLNESNMAYGNSESGQYLFQFSLMGPVVDSDPGMNITRCYNCPPCLYPSDGAECTNPEP